jgi:hypothetical protein
MVTILFYSLYALECIMWRLLCHVLWSLVILERFPASFGGLLGAQRINLKATHDSERLNAESPPGIFALRSQGWMSAMGVELLTYIPCHTSGSPFEF